MFSSPSTPSNPQPVRTSPMRTPFHEISTSLQPSRSSRSSPPLPPTASRPSRPFRRPRRRPPPARRWWDLPAEPAQVTMTDEDVDKAIGSMLGKTDLSRFIL